MLKPVTLAPFQARALSEDRLSLLIEPLPAHLLEGWDGVSDLVNLPHAVGDRLWCREEWTQTVPYGKKIYKTDWKSPDLVDWSPADEMPEALSRFTLEVVAVTVKRIQSTTREEMMLAGYQDHEGFPDDLWSRNPWCALTEVRKV